MTTDHHGHPGGHQRPAIDPDRIPHEIRRALNGKDTAEPGIWMRPEADHVVIVDRHGTEVATIPRYRLEEVDPHLIEALVLEATEGLPTHQADQVAAAVRDEAISVATPPDEDHVVIAAESGLHLVAHRSAVVAAWPAEGVGGHP